jgi:hypothetical protein
MSFLSSNIEEADSDGLTLPSEVTSSFSITDIQRKRKHESTDDVENRLRHEAQELTM